MIARNIISIIVLALLLVTCIVFIFVKFAKTLVKLASIILTLALMVCVGWVLIFLPFHENIATTGEYSVSYVSTTATDEERFEEFKNDGSKRKLELGIWYPEEKSASCDLVVFSHGSFGNINNNETLCKELASQGYVVCSIGHTYHAFEVNIDGKKVPMDKGFRNEIMSDEPNKNPEASLPRFKKWMKLRMDDINFVIDSLKNGDVDTKKTISGSPVVLMGHSLGGSAVLGVGRERSDVKAVIALESPFMADITSVSDGKFDFIDEPYPNKCLNIYSDSSYSKLGEWSQYKENNDLLNSDNPMYTNVHFQGLGHMHLCDFQLVSPFLSWILSGVDSKKSAGDNLRLLNNTVLDYLSSL